MSYLHPNKRTPTQKVKELRRLVTLAAERSERIADELKGSVNPQTVTIRIEQEAVYKVLKDVLAAINDDFVYLRIDAGE